MHNIEYQKKHYKGPHCCWETYPENVSPCSYNPKFRGYYLLARFGYGGEQIQYCPRCGKKYPKELSDEWFDILEKEYGLDDPNALDQRDRVPKEFWTDEWWKKRGL
jgi:hypothetical protein